MTDEINFSAHRANGRVDIYELEDQLIQTQAETIERADSFPFQQSISS